MMMGVMKKASMLGSSTSTDASGESAIEGDRSLLSHYSTGSRIHNAGLFFGARKSVARRGNLVARGLTRQYNDKKAREENDKVRVSRHQRQLKILENYQRQTLRNAKDEKHVEEPQSQQNSDEEDNFRENVVLAVPERVKGALSSSRPMRLMSSVVPSKRATSFLRNGSMRQIRGNQDNLVPGHSGDGVSDQVITSSSPRLCPTNAGAPRVVESTPVLGSLSSSQVQPQKDQVVEAQDLNGSLPVELAPWLSRTSRSSKVVLCELTIAKDIMMREQLVCQLKQTLPAMDVLIREFLKAQNELGQTPVLLKAAEATRAFPFETTDSFADLTLLIPSQPEADQVQFAVTKSEAAVSEAKARLDELTKRIGRRFHHLGILVTGIQQATMSIVEGILEWRRMRQRRRQLSNFWRLFRFPWRRLKISNYLLHLGGDLRTIFPSATLELLLGPNGTYNPLLLPSTTLRLLGTSSPGKTFLTERDGHVASNPFNSPNSARLGSGKSSLEWAELSKLKEELDALLFAVKSIGPAFDTDRLRHCLEAIHHEKDLEGLERQQRGEEEQRFQTTYDPFSTIKAAGGVEEALDNMMVLQSPGSQHLREKLRIRQQGACCAVLLPFGEGGQSKQVGASTDALHLAPGRLKSFLVKRSALLESVGNCELRDIQRRGQKNKLQGKLLVRANDEKRVEHHVARKIQLQYHAHRQRHALRSNLTNFVAKVRVSVINIQRIFRGYRAKCGYALMRYAWLEHKHRASAVRTIANAFRRYRRRLRHRRSMTMESIAQAQLICLLSTKLNESNDQDAVERYRRMGEERRRQRIMLLQRHKIEQQEMERRRNAAAVQMQAIVRARLAQREAKHLRQEKKAHMNAVSATAIQSTIRKFLNVRRERRERFRKDLERVNKSAIRIQSIYRGYNSRANLLYELNKHILQPVDTTIFTVDTQEDIDEEDDDEADAGNLSEIDANVATWPPDRLPLLATSIPRPSRDKRLSVRLNEDSSSRTTNPVSLPLLWTRDGSSNSLVAAAPSATGRRLSIAMTRVELKLKEAEIKDKFDTPPARRSSFVGNVRHRI